MKHFAKVNITLEEEKHGDEIAQRIHGSITGTSFAIVEIIAYMVSDQARQTKRTEGEVLTDVLKHIAVNKVAEATGAISGTHVDLTELYRNLEKTKEDGGTENAAD